MKQYIIVFLKGIAIGAANVVPGVSGGTIALIAGIFERIINAIKNTFGIKSAQLLFTGKFAQWANYTDIGFMIVLGLGVGTAVLSVARLFEFLFAVYPVYLWSFFFGLVLASVWFVGKTVKHWNVIAVFFFALGTAFAVALALLRPMGENRDVVYLVISGIAGACSMILPGISGSFVLVLMGNYELVMIEAVNNLDFSVLLPVAIGGGIGLLGFSYILAWIFKRFRDQTIALLSGFMFGSLLIIWPWKIPVWKVGPAGEAILSRSGDKIVERYQWILPSDFNVDVMVAIGFVVVGVAVMTATEIIAARKSAE